MRKTLTTIAIALSAIGAANAAEPAKVEKQSFSLDGYTYVYEVKADAKGQTITGTRFPDAVPFTFTVKGDKVQGATNDLPVAFSLAETKGAAKGAVAE